MAPFVPRERKHRKLARLASQNSISEAQTAASAEKTNPKKRKRLEKYLETKLKKEETASIISKLAAQETVDSSVLQSSKRLGRVGESKRERLQRALKERDAGISPGDELYETRHHREVSLSPVSDVRRDGATPPTQPVAAAATNTVITEKSDTNGSFGGGLKRPLETDEQGRPVIGKRKRRKKSSVSAPRSPTPVHDEGDSASDRSVSDVRESAQENEDGETEEEWQGFSDGEAVPTGSGTDTQSEDEETEAAAPSINSTRISAFKQWADMQRHIAADFTPSVVPTADASVKATFKPRAPSPDPMLDAAKVAPTSTRPTGAITIDRDETIQSARLALPVVQEEQKIMEAIHNNPIVVICGATGSGKTTQIPQILYESGYGSQVGMRETSASSPASLQNRGMVGITQPRRVAATSVADRVSHELGPSHRKRVAHQVRYDTNVSSDTAIKFMTDGILLRDIQQDFALSKYSCIVIDEAHERSVNTDILIGLLSRIVPLRHRMSEETPSKYCPLKLVIMSATLRVSDFLQNAKLFKGGPPPVVEAEGRQYPVTTHFARRTKQDFLDETVEKVAKGHKKLPPGGMLVFLTGQQEIQTVASRLKERLGGSYVNTSRNGDDYEEAAQGTGQYVEDDMADFADEPSSDAEIEVDEDNEFAIHTETCDSNTTRLKAPLKPHILQLYAALPASQQTKVFVAPPDGHRQIILATNVAETSLTIPGIRYVFDCGRSKEKVYSPSCGVQSFETQWISKASASQRTGRAGRTGPGHCWRLYSSAVYEQFFAKHADPEILRTPLESVVLQLKGFSVENVPNFPFPTPPKAEQLKHAEKLLLSIGAIEVDGITKVGQELARLPVSPRYGKMLLKARETGVLDYVAALVAGLAVGELSIPEPQTANIAGDRDEGQQQSEDIEESRQRHQAYTSAQAKLASLDERSDAVKILTAVVLHAQSAQKNGDKGAAFSTRYFLRQKNMEEAQMLRKQLWNIFAQASNPQTGMGPFQESLPPPTEAKLGWIRQATAAGFVDLVAIRADLLPAGGGTSFGRKPRRAGEVAYRTLTPMALDHQDDKKLEPSERELRRSVFVHPGSVLSRLSVAEMPKYIVYSHLSRASSSGAAAKVPRTRLHPLTAVGPKTIAYLAEKTPLVQFGKPIVGGLVKVDGKIEKRVLMESEGGKKRECWVPVSVRAVEAAGSAEWPLDAWKVVQRKDGRGNWSNVAVLRYGPDR